MARIFTDGAETGSATAGYFWSIWNAEAMSTTAKTGTYSYQIAGDNGDYAYKDITATSEGYIRFWFRWSFSVFASASFFSIRSGGTVMCSLYNVSLTDRRMSLRVGTSTVVGYTTTQFANDAWNLIEIHYKVADSGGVLQMKVNGNLEIDYSGDTKPSTETTFDRLYWNGWNWVTLLIDDLAFNDTSGATNNSWCGDGRIIHLKPNAAGDVTQLTPSTGNNWDCVDEIPSSSTDYVESNTVDYYDLYNLAASGLATGSTILNVWALAAAYDTVAAGGKFKIGLKTESTEYWSDDIAMGVSNVWYRGIIYEDNPNTSSDWTITQLDALQVGVKVRGDS